MFHLFPRAGRSGRRGYRGNLAPPADRFVERLENRTLLTIPLPPMHVIASGASATSIAVTWDASNDPSVTGYDVIERVHHVIHQPKGSPRSYDTYDLRAANLPSPSDTLAGLTTGSSHTYLVTAVNASGQSLYSLPVTAQTWVAPTFANGPSIYLLSSGALWSGPLNVTVGLTTQIKLLVSGNPLKFSVLYASSPSIAPISLNGPKVAGDPVVSPPCDFSIDSKSGVVTYTPSSDEIGTINVGFRAANALGAITQVIAFNVHAPISELPVPALSLSSTSSTYTGFAQQVAATALADDGSPVSGSFTYAYNGTIGSMTNAGTYEILATFASSDPDYGNATLLTTFTIDKANSSFNYLDSQTIAVGTSSATITGYVSGGFAAPSGEYVIATLSGVSQAVAVGTNGNFSATFATGSLPVGNYPVTFAYAGDSNLIGTLDNTSSTLSVIPTAPPQVTQNPYNTTTSAGDGVSFTAAATGSPTPSVQWQFSTDGGNTWANVTGNTSATTDTLIFTSTSINMNGYKYRAVYTNSIGTAITTFATLTVEPGD